MKGYRTICCCLKRVFTMNNSLGELPTHGPNETFFSLQSKTLTKAITLKYISSVTVTYCGDHNPKIGSSNSMGLGWHNIKPA